MDTITIKNFQSHKKTVITLAPTLTAITGKSDHGKSSIIRALRWVYNNKPQGFKFIHKDTKKAIIVMTLCGQSTKGPLRRGAPGGTNEATAITYQ